VTTAVPLIGVLSLTAIKDAYDDIVSLAIYTFLYIYNYSILKVFDEILYVVIES
jgi:hypothetical protein